MQPNSIDCCVCGKSRELRMIESAAGKEKKLSLLLAKYGGILIKTGRICRPCQYRLINIHKNVTAFRNQCLETAKKLQQAVEACQYQKKSNGSSTVGKKTNICSDNLLPQSGEQKVLVGSNFLIHIEKTDSQDEESTYEDVIPKVEPIEVESNDGPVTDVPNTDVPDGEVNTPDWSVDDVKKEIRTTDENVPTSKRESILKAYDLLPKDGEQKVLVGNNYMIHIQKSGSENGENSPENFKTKSILRGILDGPKKDVCRQGDDRPKMDVSKSEEDIKTEDVDQDEEGLDAHYNSEDTSRKTDHDYCQDSAQNSKKENARQTPDLGLYTEKQVPSNEDRVSCLVSTKQYQEAALTLSQKWREMLASQGKDDMQIRSSEHGDDVLPALIPQISLVDRQVLENVKKNLIPNLKKPISKGSKRKDNAYFIVPAKTDPNSTKVQNLPEQSQNILKQQVWKENIITIAAKSKKLDDVQLKQQPARETKKSASGKNQTLVVVPSNYRPVKETVNSPPAKNTNSVVVPLNQQPVQDNEKTTASKNQTLVVVPPNLQQGKQTFNTPPAKNRNSGDVLPNQQLVKEIEKTAASNNQKLVMPIYQQPVKETANTALINNQNTVMPPKVSESKKYCSILPKGLSEGRGETQFEGTRKPSYIVLPPTVTQKSQPPTILYDAQNQRVLMLPTTDQQGTQPIHSSIDYKIRRSNNQSYIVVPQSASEQISQNVGDLKPGDNQNLGPSSTQLIKTETDVDMEEDANVNIELSPSVSQDLQEQENLQEKESDSNSLDLQAMKSDYTKKDKRLKSAGKLIKEKYFKPALKHKKNTSMNSTTGKPLVKILPKLEIDDLIELFLKDDEPKPKNQNETATDYVKKVQRPPNNSKICDVCGKFFEKRESMRSHMKIHATRLFKCNQCGKAFVRKFHLIEHLNTHSKEKPFVCDLCGKSLRFQSSFIKHLKIHKRELHVGCDICGKPYTDKSTMLRHRIQHDRWSNLGCEVCGQTYRSKQQLAKHMKEHKDKPNVCLDCDETFDDEDKFKRHTAGHFDVLPYGCGLCRKTFAKTQHLYNHTKKMHTVRKQYRYECTQCDLLFFNRETLDQHASSHRDLQKVCDDCGETFADDESLQKHIPSHRLNDPCLLFGCGFCDKGFSKSAHLKFHMKKHQSDD